MAIYRDTRVFCLSITGTENFQYCPLLTGLPDFSLCCATVVAHYTGKFSTAMEQLPTPNGDLGEMWKLY